MLFNSVQFLFYFLPFVVAGYFLISRYVSHAGGLFWLTLASYFFYGWWDYRYLLLLAGSTCFNFLVGRKIIDKAQVDGASVQRWLVLGITTNLLLIAYFKYSNFFVESLSTVIDIRPWGMAFLVPIAVTGISFFTFTQIAYLVDAARGEAREYDFLRYALFVSFFPHLIAGPILHHSEMMPQFKQFNPFTQRVFAGGLAYFLIGLGKKVVLADSLAVFAAPVFDGAAHGMPVMFFDAWTGVLAYTFQIYFDFSGYSDMAIGAALMLGIRLPLNFNSPYRAQSITEFWRRWHMTLSRFLRDYLYIPLGGNRRGSRAINIMTTMLLGGLWHGAGWTFILWGGLHGLYLSLNHAWRFCLERLGLDYLVSFGIYRWFAGTLTFLAVVIAWVFFGARSVATAFNIIDGMTGRNGLVLPNQVLALVPALRQFVEGTVTVPLLGGGTILGIFEVSSLLILSFVIVLLFPPTHRMSLRLKMVALAVSMPFTIQAVLFGHAPSPFLYFQF